MTTSETTGQTCLLRARDAWLAAAAQRAQRARCKRFTYGRQWSDPGPGGYTEAELAEKNGRRPLTNNLIRQLVKTVIGRFRALAEERKTYDDEPGSDRLRNQLAELDCRMLEEFLISGTAVQRIVAERRLQGSGVWVDNVSPDRFFCNAYHDPRGFDIDLAGMLHDMSPAELLARFGGSNAQRQQRLRRIYKGLSGSDIPLSPGMTLAATDFFTPDPGKWRVVELWTLDAVSAARSRGGGRERSARLDFVWQCRWLAPDGTVLSSYASPFAHGTHPFAVRHYPFTDGEVHSFVADLLDQQRCINRLITMIDHIMSCSAKGVLLFPRGADGAKHGLEEGVRRMVGRRRRHPRHGPRHDAPAGGDGWRSRRSLPAALAPDEDFRGHIRRGRHPHGTQRQRSPRSRTLRGAGAQRHHRPLRPPPHLRRLHGPAR